ncbi:MAG: hypothetical protein KDA79_15565 [Planctomycetaceae bacterium]|nr:hypothetical protein [Planctomycetaceae bacterium]
MPSDRSDPAESGSEDELSRRWREKSLRYVSAINSFVERGLRDGWEKAGKQPKDTRQTMAKAVLAAVRRANDLGTTDELREKFPPAHEPFGKMIEVGGPGLPVATLLDDGRVVLCIADSWESHRFVEVHERHIEPLDASILSIGRSPDRRYFAVARPSGVQILDGWGGPVVAALNWPDGLEEPPTVTQIIPFPDGDSALLVSPEGVFVLQPGGAVRLLPRPEELEECQKEDLSSSLAMEHGAISPDGRYIATGHQSSPHYVFDTATCHLVAEIGPMSEYPHYAAFSSDGAMVILNACHFYSGATIGVPTTLLPGLRTEYYETHPQIPTLEDGARVYAAVYRPDEFIIGDAYGYLRAFDRTGKRLWQHYVGGTINCIDISQDGKELVVSTFAGFLCFLELDTGKRDPFTIGTSMHRERRRWLFWKNESRPLIW